MKSRILGVLAAGLLSTPMASQAVVLQLDFEGIGNLAPVGNFYAGAGATFSSATLAIVDADAGGDGNFANEPSPNTIMFFLDADDAILTYAAGFTTGFSFFYSSSTAATVNVFDGLDGTGNLLAQLDLTAQGFDNCVGDPFGDFCNWTAIGVLFNGTARSINFGGTANQTGFDNITFGTDDPTTDPNSVPEPGTLALLGLGLTGLALSRRRKAA